MQVSPTIFHSCAVSPQSMEASEASPTSCSTQVREDHARRRNLSIRAFSSSSGLNRAMFGNPDTIGIPSASSQYRSQVSVSKRLNYPPMLSKASSPPINASMSAKIIGIRHRDRVQARQRPLKHCCRSSPS